MTNDIDRLVASIAPDPGPGMTPGARELLREIMSGTAAEAAAPARTRRLRPRVMLPAAALLTAAILVLTWVVPAAAGFGPSRASALDIRREDGHYIVMVRQLFADPGRYETELREHHINLTLNVVPVSPSLVGAIVTGSDDVEAIQRRGPCAAELKCPIGLKISVSYRGRAEIALGRKARPGERYWPVRTSADSRGEPLHCVDYVNKTVDQVRQILATRGLRLHPTTYWAAWRHPVPGTWYVHDGVMESKDTVLMVAAPTPDPGPRSRDHCAKRR